jgi:hypothetical protein
VNLVNFGEASDAKVNRTTGANHPIPAPDKESNMIKSRYFNIFIVAALLIMAALTIQGAIETTRVAMAAGNTGGNPHPLEATNCLWSEIDRSSIRSVYLDNFGVSLPRSNSGYTGYDGGLIYLLSEHHACPVEEN